VDVIELAAIGEAGETVGKRQLGELGVERRQLILRPLLLGHIGEQDQRAALVGRAGPGGKPATVRHLDQAIAGRQVHPAALVDPGADIDAGHELQFAAFERRMQDVLEAGTGYAQIRCKRKHAEILRIAEQDSAFPVIED